MRAAALVLAGLSTGGSSACLNRCPDGLERARQEREGSLAQPGWAGPTVDGLEGRRARPQHQRDRGGDHQGASQ